MTSKNYFQIYLQHKILFKMILFAYFTRIRIFVYCSVPENFIIHTDNILPNHNSQSDLSILSINEKSNDINPPITITQNTKIQTLNKEFSEDFLSSDEDTYSKYQHDIDSYLQTTSKNDSFISIDSKTEFSSSNMKKTFYKNNATEKSLQNKKNGDTSHDCTYTDEYLYFYDKSWINNLTDKKESSDLSFYAVLRPMNTNYKKLGNLKSLKNSKISKINDETLCEEELNYKKQI